MRKLLPFDFRLTEVGHLCYCFVLMAFVSSSTASAAHCVLLRTNYMLDRVYEGKLWVSQSRFYTPDVFLVVHL